MENKLYITAKELHELIPQIGIQQCRKIIQEAQGIMKKENMYIPKCKELIAYWEIVKEILGIKRG